MIDKSQRASATHGYPLSPLGWALGSGAVAALALLAASAVQELVFALPALVATVLVPAVLCVVIFAVTLTLLARRGQDDVRVALKVLLGWLVVCPLLHGLGVYALRALSFAGEPFAAEIPTSLIAGHKAMQAVVRGFVGVGFAGLLLLRAWLRPRAQ